MKFLKIYCYDLRQGLLGSPFKGVALLFLAAFLFFSFSLDVFHFFYFDVTGLGDINSLGLSFGDVMLTQTGGMLPLDARSTIHEFVFPVKWFFLHALILYFTLNYTSDDLTRCGIQVITRTESKWTWWLSKCLLTVTATFIYYFLFTLSLFLLCAATGKTLDMTINGGVFLAFFGQETTVWTQTGMAMFLSVCVLPCVVGIAIGLVQLMLTLLVKPITAYLVVCVYLIAGIFYIHPALLSNYAITVRSRAVGIYPLELKEGLLLCVAISLVAIIEGGLHMQKMDMLQET